MAEININLTELQNSITKLQSLQSKCASENVAPPSVIGGGNTTNELEAIGNLYKALSDDLTTLISNTAAFLQNVKDSFETMDEAAGTTLSSGGGSSR